MRRIPLAVRLKAGKLLFSFLFFFKEVQQKLTGLAYVYSRVQRTDRREK